MKITDHKIAVYGCILNNQGKILIIKRAGFDSSPHIWEMPGGALELGESIQEAIVREIEEEVGLTVNPTYPLATLSTVSQKNPTQQIIRIAYLCDSNVNQNVVLSNEHCEYIWTGLADINKKPLSDLLIELVKLSKKFPHLIQ